MKTLIGMREFVLLEFSKRNVYYYQDSKVLNKINNYANFLSRQPQLSDFVACGKDGLPLIPIESRIYPASMSYAKQIEDDKIAYQQALDKVLFKGFEWNTAEFCDEPMLELTDKNGNYFVYDCEDKTFQDGDEVFYSTLESLTPYNLELNDNAKNIIDGNV